MEAGYKLYYEDGREALRHVIENGKGYKPTAHFLWPSMNPDSAYARLKSCTKQDGDQKLEFDEVILVMTFNDRFDALMHACDQVHHDRPARRAPEDRQAQLIGEFNQSVEKLASLAEQIRSTGGLKCAALATIQSEFSRGGGRR